MKWLVALWLVLWTLLLGLYAQTPAPTLSEVHRLQFQNLSQQLEIAQLKAQAAQRDYDRAQGDIEILTKQVQVKGFIFDLQTLTYRPEPEPPKTP